MTGTMTDTCDSDRGHSAIDIWIPTDRCLEWAKELAEAELRARVRGRASRDSAGESSRGAAPRPYPPSPPFAVLPLEACSRKPFSRCRRCTGDVRMHFAPVSGALNRRTAAAWPGGFPGTRLAPPPLRLFNIRMTDGHLSCTTVP